MSERPGRTAFIGFTYGGEHSIEHYNIYRTSNGDRYDHNLIPQIADKVVDVPGGDGQYYFKTNYKTRQFSIPIAFDKLNQTQFDAMKKWLNGKEIKPLVFDERTEVTYSAKVTGTPQLKYVCFDDNYTVEEDGVLVTKTRNIYKGEGTIQFTCYFPFGYGENEVTSWQNTSTTVDSLINDQATIGGELPTTFVFTGVGITGEIQIGNLKITPSSSSFVWDSKTGLVTNNNTPINYTGTSYGTVGEVNESTGTVGSITISFTLEPNGSATFTRKKLYY